MLWCAVLLAGCGRSAGVIFEPGADGPVWPPPPDVARVRYLGQIQTDQDLKPGRRPGQGLGELIFGKDPAHGMLSPVGVCTDGGSRLFVADSNAQVIHVFDLQTRKYQQWIPGPSNPRFSMPVAVAYDPPGRLLVADSVGGLIFEFDAAGVCTRTMGLGKLNRPCGIAIEPHGGRMFIADAGAHQVVVLGRGGEEVGRMGRRGSEPGCFNFPTQLAFDAAGRLYVSDSLNFRIQVFSAELLPLRQIGSKGDMPGSFAQPKGLGIDPDGHVYVVDANFESVQTFDEEGRLLLSFGREGRGPGEFWLPAGLHIDASGRIWVADTYNKRIQVFQYEKEARTP